MLRNIVFSGNNLLKRVNVSAPPSRFIRSRKHMAFARVNNTKRYALFKQYIDYNKMITEQLNKARDDNIKLLALIEKTQGPNCETLMRPTQPIPQNSVKKTNKDETSLSDVISIISMFILVFLGIMTFPPLAFAIFIVVLLS